MSVRYSEDFKKEVVKAYIAGNKSIPQIAIEYTKVPKIRHFRRRFL